MYYVMIVVSGCFALSLVVMYIICDLLNRRINSLFKELSDFKFTVADCGKCSKKIICQNIAKVVVEDYDRFLYKTCMKDSCIHCEDSRRDICTSYAIKEDSVLLDIDGSVLGFNKKGR